MRHRNRGFTVIELLLALALTSLLTAGISVMIGQAARDRHAMQQDIHAPAWSRALIDLLERDLRQARWYAGSEDRFILIGLGLDGLPAQIEYRWVVLEQATVLTRKENTLTVRHRKQPADEQVLAIGLRGINIGQYGFGKIATEAHGSRASITTATPDGPALLIKGQQVPLQAVPDQILIQVEFSADPSSGAQPSGIHREVLLR